MMVEQGVTGKSEKASLLMEKTDISSQNMRQWRQNFHFVHLSDNFLEYFEGTKRLILLRL